MSRNPEGRTGENHGQAGSRAGAESDRPEDCVCDDLNEFIDLPCWPCYRDGFEEPASGVTPDA